MPLSQTEKADRFRALHHGPDSFIIANAWDAGSARILAGLGFDAIATSSGAFAGTLGRRDGMVTREEALTHCKAVCDAVELPVSADLENGFGDAPEVAAETVRLAARTGLVGCSIEDATGDRDQPLYEFEAAVERIQACVEAAQSLDIPFTLTGRCENFLRGNPDLDDTIRRLKAYEDTGVDVLMAPGLPTLDAVSTVCDALDKPFSFMVGIPGRSFPKADLERAGVRRISLATALYRSAIQTLIEAATEAKEQGTFGFVETGIPMAQLSGYMA